MWTWQFTQSLARPRYEFFLTMHYTYLMVFFWWYKDKRARKYWISNYVKTDSKIDRYQSMSCPEVMYQTYYPYLYQRASTSAPSTANLHRAAHFSPFSHQYDRVSTQHLYVVYLQFLRSVVRQAPIYRREVAT